MSVQTDSKIAVPQTIQRLEYPGFHGCPSCCGLELIPLRDGRTLVIATELPNNPGTSVTNIAEQLASLVCLRFSIDPQKLVWVEHYGYANTTFPERTFDLVTFQPHQSSSGNPKSVGDSAVYQLTFTDPHWVTMTDADWRALGLPPRPPALYEQRKF